MFVIPPLDCFICFCQEHSSHLDKLQNKNKKYWLEKVSCYRTFCEHWYHEKQRSQKNRTKLYKFPLSRFLTFLEAPPFGATQRQFSENICSEHDLRSRIFGTFVACQNIRFPSLFAAGCVSRETSPAAKSEEKRMFSQARISCLPASPRIFEHLKKWYNCSFLTDFLP